MLINALAEFDDVLVDPHQEDGMATLRREQLGSVDPTRSNPNPSCPERALLRAVLYDAVLCLLGQGVSPRERARVAAEARRWIKSKAQDSLFAFETICHILDLDPEYLRRRLLRDRPAVADENTPARAEGRIHSVRLRGNDHVRGMHRARVDGRHGNR